MTAEAPPPGGPSQLSPDQLAQIQSTLQQQLEFQLGGFGGTPDEEGASLGGIVSTIRERTARGREIEDPERLTAMEQAFDQALATDINQILSNYDRLYYPSEWELEGQIKQINGVRTMFERRIKTFEKKGGGGETLEAMRRMHKKVLWAQGLETVLAGGMISTATYYAGEERIKNIPKIKITGADNMQAFHETLPGLPNDEIRDGVINREVIIQMQDTAMSASYIVAAGLQQQEVETAVSNTPATAPRERERMYLDPRTRQMMEEIFAVRDENGNIERVNWIDPKTGQEYRGVAKDFVNYFCLMNNTEAGRREYINLMTSVVYLNVLNRLEAGEDPIALANEVRTEAKRLQDNPYSQNMFKDSKELYANLLTRSMIAKHLGDMTAGELGWGWTYEVNTLSDLQPVEVEKFKNCMVGFAQLTPDQQKSMRKRAAAENWPPVEGLRFVVVRISEIGSIYNADDIPSPMYPERYVEEYQARAESAAEVHKGLADGFRRLIRYERPDWRPDYQQFCADNPFVLNRINMLLEDQYANMRERRNGGTYGPTDKRMLDYMKKYVRVWPTWVTTKNGQPYAVPYFYPPAWYSLNFWRSIGENGRKAMDAPSVHERFMEGQKLSKVDFTKYSDQVVDWANVNRAQLARGLVILYLSHKFSSDGSNQFGNFVARPLDINTLKDFDKRMARLGVRGEDVMAGVTGMLTFVPMAVKLIAEQTGVGQLGDPQLTDKSDRQEIEKAYRNAIAELKLNAAYLPRTKGLSKTAAKNWNMTYAKIVHAYSLIEMDWQIKAAQQTHKDLLDEAVLFQEDMNSILKMNGISSAL